jgi:GT2 family glycosyltransferase
VTPTVSIIIAVGTPGDYIRECIEHCRLLEYPDFEIIVLPDNPWEPPFPDIRVIPTGKVRPAEKRDRGVDEARGDIVAIIDDDAWPDPEWLKNAVRHFKKPVVAAVGGPGVTPPDDSLLQKVSGWVYESPLVSGGYSYRYRPGPKQDVDDYPTSSLIIRKADFIAAGGFDTGYWPGEDTILCMKLTHELGKRIVYDPSVLVYHHRRAVFSPHLRQIRSYALHRGFFVKRFPKTSLKPGYFVPSLFVLFAGLGWTVVFVWPRLIAWWALTLCVYAVLVLGGSLRTFDPRGIVLTALGIVATHITYGIWFLKGLVSREVRD